MLFKLNIFHGDLYCCVKYSIEEYEDEIFKWLDLILDLDFVFFKTYHFMIFFFHEIQC